MKPLTVLVLSVVQALTEFLPVSSSGHLVLFGRLLPGGAETPGIALEVVLHLGTLLAVVFYYRRDIAAIARGASRGERGSIRMLLLLALASVPAALAGLLLKGAVERAFEAPALVTGLLALNGLVLLAAGLPRAGGSRTRTHGVFTALAGGLAQAAAVLPGISRSGSTISAMCAAGLPRREAARFSFLMSVPAVAGAGLLEAGSMGSVRAGDLPLLAMGCIVSAAAGYFALKGLIGILGRGRLWVFGVYCLVAAGVSAAVILPGV